MRSSRTLALLLLGASASLAPLSAGALEIKFCIPNCTVNETEPPPAIVTLGPGTPVLDANGVWTNAIPIASFVHTNGATSFTINATVTSQQAASLQKITFNPTVITANLGSPCSVLAPCRMEVVATSDHNDFPVEKPIGGYPAGVFMMGAFTGPQGISPTGDTIAMTGEASGLRLITEGDNIIGSQPVSADVINATPGTGPANIGVSLPSSCTGNPGCKFIATALRKAFSTQITETIQQICDGTATSCRTRLVTRLNIEIKTAGNRVSLPLDHITTNEVPGEEPGDPPLNNPTLELVSGIAAPFGDMEVNSLTVGVNGFSLTATVRLDATSTLDPTTNEVFFRVGDFSMTILPGFYRTQQLGRVYHFAGRIDGRDVNTTFTRDRVDPSVWKFAIGVQGVSLTGVPRPPLETPVEIGIGGRTGTDLVTADFRQSVK
jgi:hypothetical protein